MDLKKIERTTTTAVQYPPASAIKMIEMLHLAEQVLLGWNVSEKSFPPHLPVVQASHGFTVLHLQSAHRNKSMPT